MVPHGLQTYPDNGELRQPNEIDLPLITLGSSTDAAFKQALADAIDPLGNLDRNEGLIVDHDVLDPNYPYFMPMEMTPAGKPIAEKGFPWSSDKTIASAEFHRPWAYPNLSPDTDLHLHPTPTEQYDPTLPGTDLDHDGKPPDFDGQLRPGPFPLGSTPEVFFRGWGPDRQVRPQYEAAPTPRATDSLNMQHLLSGDRPRSPLGDPVPFSAYLIGQIANDTGYRTQFNLDSDRAYAYQTWDWIRQPYLDDGNDATELDEDDMGRKFVAPQTWPALSPHFVEPGNGPDVAVRLEYLGEWVVAEPRPNAPGQPEQPR